MADMVIVTEKNNNGQPLADKDRRAAFVNTAGALRMSDAGFDRFRANLALVRK